MHCHAFIESPRHAEFGTANPVRCPARKPGKQDRADSGRTGAATSRRRCCGCWGIPRAPWLTPSAIPASERPVSAAAGADSQHGAVQPGSSGRTEPLSAGRDGRNRNDRRRRSLGQLPCLLSSIGGVCTPARPSGDRVQCAGRRGPLRWPQGPGLSRPYFRHLETEITRHPLHGHPGIPGKVHGGHRCQPPGRRHHERADGQHLQGPVAQGQRHGNTYSSGADRAPGAPGTARDWHLSQ